jgi:hypothetical protein
MKLNSEIYLFYADTCTSFDVGWHGSTFDFHFSANREP